MSFQSYYRYSDGRLIFSEEPELPPNHFWFREGEHEDYPLFVEKIINSTVINKKTNKIGHERGNNNSIKYALFYVEDHSEGNKINRDKLTFCVPYIDEDRTYVDEMLKQSTVPLIVEMKGKWVLTEPIDGHETYYAKYEKSETTCKPVKMIWDLSIIPEHIKSKGSLISLNGRKYDILTDDYKRITGISRINIQAMYKTSLYNWCSQNGIECINKPAYGFPTLKLRVNKYDYKVKEKLELIRLVLEQDLDCDYKYYTAKQSNYCGYLIPGDTKNWLSQEEIDEIESTQIISKISIETQYTYHIFDKGSVKIDRNKVKDKFRKTINLNKELPDSAEDNQHEEENELSDENVSLIDALSTLNEIEKEYLVACCKEENIDNIIKKTTKSKIKIETDINEKLYSFFEMNIVDNSIINELCVDFIDEIIMGCE